jgi:tRNA(Arg) A34 adenosine deaminase TadA
VKLNNPSPQTNDLFGNSVAVSGMRVVVGAYLDNTGENQAGSAYVYDLAGATPTVPAVTLNNPTPSLTEKFGSAVVISGTRVVIGAPDENSGVFFAGSAYVYDLASTTPTVPVATLASPSPAMFDQFGFSLSISGTRLVVGDYNDDSSGSFPGRAYVYELAGATPALPMATLDNPSPEFADDFGWSVAISGTRVVVGDVHDDTGASDAGSAYVYDLASGAPSVPLTVLNNPGPGIGDSFGSSLAVSGTWFVVGAPYARTGTANSGIACVYDLASATPTVPLLTLSNPHPAAYGNFGNSVAISGTRIVIGDYLDYTLGQQTGSAFVYDLASATPAVPMAVLDNPSPEQGDTFGSSVAVSGTRVVIGATNDKTGAYNAGSAYVYDLASATPTVPIATLNNPSPAPNDWFGARVAISGTRVVVGASQDDTGATDSGSAYVYDLTSATPSVPVATLNNPEPAYQDQFGSSVAISGTRIVIGAHSDNTGVPDTGSAYVHDLASPTPTVPVTTLNNPSPQVNDLFGLSVAIDSTTILVGAPYDDSPQLDKGSAYVYGPSPYSLWKVSELSNQFAPDLGNPDGDELRNLGEYGLLRSPTTSEGAATSVEPALYAEGERLRMFVPRDPTRNDITLEVQATANLAGPWTTIATSTLGAPFTGPGYFGGDSATPGVKSVEVRDTVNVDDATQRFLRVRVRH